MPVTYTNKAIRSGVIRERWRMAPDCRWTHWVARRALVTASFRDRLWLSPAEGRGTPEGLTAAGGHGAVAVERARRARRCY